MQRKPLSGGRLRSAGYDERQQLLEIEFTDHSVTVYKHVPAEVYRRLLASPNPAAYFDDRIADEYPRERGSAGGDDEARRKLDDLFGPPKG